MTHKFRFAHLPVLLCLWGCSSQAESGPLYGETGGAPNIQVEGTGGTGGGVNSCAAYQDAAPGAMNVKLVNASSKSLYVDGFRISDASGVIPHSRPGCGQSSCGDMQRSDFQSGCPTIYIPPSVVEIKPGETSVERWDGRVTSRVTLPKECVKASTLPAEPITCEKYSRIQSGVYTVHAVASTAISCPDDRISTCTVCAPRADGGCVITGVQATPVITASTQVTISAGGATDSSAAVAAPAFAEVILTFRD